jgi:hypothetical protein
MNLISCAWCGVVYDLEKLSFRHWATVDGEGNRKSYCLCKVCDEMIWEPPVIVLED